MFTDNQKFVITGDNEDSLKKVVKLAIELSGAKIIGYYIDSIMGMVFIKDKDIDKLPKDAMLVIFEECEVGNFEYLMNHIFLYISSSSYKKLKTIVQEELHSYFEYFDGGTLNGWEVGAWEESHKYKVDCPYDWKRVFYVRPFITAYSK